MKRKYEFTPSSSFSDKSINGNNNSSSFKSDYMKSKDLAPEKKYEFEKDGLFWRFKSLNHRNY